MSISNKVVASLHVAATAYPCVHQSRRISLTFWNEVLGHVRTFWSTTRPTMTNNQTRPLSTWKRRTSQPSRLHCHKMFVPGFGEAPPEAKAANNLHNFFTYIAVKIVAAQLESYNPEAHKDLIEFLARHSLNDGDKFCSSLMRESSKHKSLALRILEVRSAYCRTDFEWDNLKRLTMKRVNESNTKLMRDYVLETSHVE